MNHSWREDPNAPLRTLLSILDCYAHPENGPEAHDVLIERVRTADPDDTEIQTFKAELERAIVHGTRQLDPDALSETAQYDDGNDESFLRRLWIDLYPNEQVPNVGLPFHTLLSVIDKHVHPEAHPEAHDDLLARAKEAAPDDVTMVEFKAELTRALTGDTAGLHPDALFVAGAYDDGTDEAFLRRLWSELYPDEPVPESQPGEDE